MLHVTTLHTKGAKCRWDFPSYKDVTDILCHWQSWQLDQNDSILVTLYRRFQVQFCSVPDSAEAVI